MLKSHLLVKEDYFNIDLLLFYLLWLIVIAPKEIQFVFIGVILLDLLRRHKITFDLLSYFIISFITIYLLSIVYNLFLNSYELDRLLATFNTFSMWVFALIYYLIFKTIPLEISQLKKITFINYLILVILSVCSIVIHFFTNIANFRVLNQSLYYTEWFANREVVRFVGFLEYPNLVIMFFMFFYPLYILYILDFKNFFLRILLIVLGLFPILSTFSRSGYLIILIYLLVLSVIYLYRSSNQQLFISFASISLAVVVCVIAYTNFPKELFFMLQELLSAREGSNDSRTFLMTESIRVAWDVSPIIGTGIKVTSLIGYPLGSHSTFVGFFYKTGILGCIAGGMIFLIISLKILLSRMNFEKTIIKISLLLMIPLFMVEDIDGSNWLIIMYFLFVALLFNEKKEIVS